MPTSERTTSDAFLGGAVTIEQPARGYRAGLDAVLLAAAAGIVAGQGARVLDVGAGVGVAGLCVAAMVADSSVWLVERESELVAIARRNVAGNGLEARIRVVEADVTAGGAALHAANRSADEPPALRPGAFSHVIANPPYYAPVRSSATATPIKDAAHQMPDGALSAWMRYMVTALVADGVATVIHHADAMIRLLSEMDGRLGALRILPICARPGGAATRIIVQGIKGSRAPATLLSGLVLHEAAGNGFRAEIDGILRRGDRIDMTATAHDRVRPRACAAPNATDI